MRSNQTNGDTKPKSRVRKKSANTAAGAAEKPKHNKKAPVAGIVAGLVAVWAIGLVGYGAYAVYGTDTIPTGVNLLGESLKGKTQQEIATFVDEKNAMIGQGTITLSMGENSQSMTLADLGVRMDSTTVAQQAATQWKDGGFFTNVLSFYRMKFDGETVIPVMTYDQEKVEETVSAFNLESSNQMVPNSFTVDYDNALVTVQKGITGEGVDQQKLNEAITKAIEEADLSTAPEIQIEVPIDTVEPDALTGELIKEKTDCEPKDAYIVTNAEGHDEVVAEIVGVTVDTQAAQQAVDAAAGAESFTVPVTLTQPQVNYYDLVATMFKDELSSYTTKFTAGDKNRNHNIALAASKVNGTILQPGEVFSYNNVVGSRTEEAGFLPAGIFTSKGHDTGIGGGVCQPSSTLYVAQLYADLETVERHNHGFPVGYVPNGWDATVFFGSLDYQFRNNTNYPVKIEMTTTDTSITARILGTKTSDKEVTITSGNAYNYTKCGETVTEDPTLAAGQRVVTQKGINGFSVDTYVKVVENGAVIKDGKITTSVYRTANAQVRVGTQKAASAPAAAAPAAEPAAEPAPAPSEAPAAASEAFPS